MLESITERQRGEEAMRGRSIGKDYNELSNQEIDESYSYSFSLGGGNKNIFTVNQKESQPEKDTTTHS